MTFFNPKEDVIDIEFTQFGKHLLSQGKWNPSYYAFFDDDVIYDAEYGGVLEPQNAAQPRITGSIRPRTQYAFAGIETEVRKQLDRVPWDASEYDKINLQPTMDRDYALSLSMGRSDVGNQHFPAWSVTFLHGELSSSVPYSTSSLGIMPLIEMVSDNVVFKTSVRNRGEEEARALDFSNTLNQVGESDPPIDPSDLILANRIYDDGSYINIEEDYLLLEILEQNTPFEEENVQIEVFMHEENAKGQPVLTPLRFSKKKKMVVNDILLDDNDPELNQQQTLTPDYVEYFFNVWVDDEIDLETLCKSVIKRRNLGLYAPPIQCPDRAARVEWDGGDYDCPECPDIPPPCPDVNQAPCDEEDTET